MSTPATPNAVTVDQVFAVQARSYGEVAATALFLTAEEAAEFRDECIAFEATRYLTAESGAVDFERYLVLREDFDKRHPWMRFSRGVEFVVGTQMLGRPVKAQA